MMPRATLLALLILACNTTPTDTTAADQATSAPDADATLATFPPDAAPAPVAKPAPKPQPPPAPMTPISREEQIALAKLMADLQVANARLGKERILLEEKLGAAMRKVETSRDAAQKAVIDAVSSIAKTRQLPPACFAGFAEGKAREQCVAAGKLWGIDASGAVGYLRPPPPAQP